MATGPMSTRRALLGPLACLLCAALVWVACGSEAEQEPALDPELAGLPPTAVIPTLLDLREEMATVRHPSDGGGRAWLEEGPREVEVRTRHTWTFLFEVGPAGIAPGGRIDFMTSPFWGWEDPPQVSYPDAPGYTVVTTDAGGVELEPHERRDGQTLSIAVGGRALREGERVRVVYGQGAGAIADSYRERGSTFWFFVDGDGDGVRAVLEECPRIDVLPGPPAGLWMTVPTSVAVGAEARVVLALLDARANACASWTGDVVFAEAPEGLELPERVAVGPDAGASCAARATAPGIYTLRARLDPPLPGTPDDFYYESNPMVVSQDAVRVLWADLHGHSQLSDGTGDPRDFYRYARDVAALDVAALTDHDHFGVRFLDRSPELWSEIEDVAREFHEPGRFVSLLGYEWTSWIYGHRHVLYFTDEGELYSSMDPRTEHPVGLWDALRGKAALTFAHHSAGGPIATDWSIAPDPELEPVTEVVSIHGCSEAADAPALIHRPVKGNYVRDALDRGYRLGFVGSGDTHDGHPGLGHLRNPSGGLAAILSEDLTREGVLAALRARRAYATNGQRILLRASLGGHRMGSTLAAEEAGTLELRVHVVGTGPVESLELVVNGAVHSIDCEGRREVLLPPLAVELASGDYLYVRVIQQDGGAAWSSPFYVE